LNSRIEVYFPSGRGQTMRQRKTHLTDCFVEDLHIWHVKGVKGSGDLEEKFRGAEAIEDGARQISQYPEPTRNTCILRAGETRKSPQEEKRSEPSKKENRESTTEFTWHAHDDMWWGDARI